MPLIYMGMHFFKAVFMWAMFRVFMELVTISLLVFVSVFGATHDEGLKPHPLYWKVKLEWLDCQGRPWNAFLRLT